MKKVILIVEENDSKDFVENYMKKECENQGVSYDVVCDKNNALVDKDNIILSFNFDTIKKTANAIICDTSEKNEELTEFLQEANEEVLEATKKELAKYYVAAISNYFNKSTKK